MKFKLILGLFLFLFSVTHSSALEIELSSHTREGLTIKVNVPDFQVEKRDITGSIYHLLTIDGWGKTEIVGSPQLPFRGMLIGIPAQGKVTAELIQGNVEEFSGLTIYPCPQKEVEERDGEIFSREKFYQDDEAYVRDSYSPGKVVDVTSTGYLRGQRVAKVDIYPFQYNPAKKVLKVYREMVIQISFEGEKLQPLSFRREERAYESMLKKLLLNYDSLGRQEVDPLEKIEGLVTAKKKQKTPLKFHLTAEGVYKITRSNLCSLWKLSKINPRKIHLKHLGSEIPILFEGESDGKFGKSDYFLFYAPSLESEYTKDDVYWLSVESTDGLRMDSIDGSVGSGQLLSSFDNLYNGEEDKEYWQTIPNGEGKDHWFWKKLTITSPSQAVTSDITFTLNNILNTSADCTLTFSFRGKTNDSVNPDHHIQVSINGNLVSDDIWDGQSEFEKTVTFSQSYLQEGTNTLMVKSVGDTGATVDTVYFNWFDLTYKDTYVAEGNLLQFKGEGSGDYRMDISGFTSSDILLFDITDPVNPKRVTNTNIISGNTINFEDTIYGSKEYIVVTNKSTKTPSLIEADVTSNLKDTSHDADYIIITHENFYRAIQPLVKHRKSQGKKVMVVKIGDVYDEFSYGLFDPQAIRDFLKYAYENYKTPPVDVLLVGDADMDYKDNFNNDSQGWKNYVPTHLFETTELGETPTDNWFVCVSGDDILPDMYIGRISVKTASEVTGVINKIKNYEKSVEQDWNKKALFVADNETTFETVNDTLATEYLPADYSSYKVYLSQYSSTEEAKNDLISNINNGKLITVYTGHGSVKNWAGEYLFTNSDVPSLENSGKPTCVITLNCLNGFFPSPKEDCLGEEFVKAKDKGAIACYAPTGLGYTWEHTYLAEELFDSIFQDGNYLLGVATTEAKINAYVNYGVSSDIVQTFVLLGDPLNELKHQN
jgi:hypothetical protein